MTYNSTWWFGRTMLTLGVTALVLGSGVAREVRAEEAAGQIQGRSFDLAGDVTVSANKIEEDVTRVPQSITVLTQELLEEKGIRNIAEVINEIPNMSVSPNHGSSVNFRGLNTSMFTNNNPVVIYVDGVPYSDRYGFDTSLANVERIEVLRGPQGTLYGKDAIGAVINVVTKQPANTWQGQVGSEYGSHNYVQGTLQAGGPLIEDRLYLGIDGQFRRSDGWITNHYPGMRDDFNEWKDARFGGNLLYTPTDRLKVRLTLRHDYEKEFGEDGYALPAGARIADFNRRDAKRVAFDVPTYARYRSDSQGLSVDYDLGALTLASSTTHRRLDIKGEYDADFGNNPLFAGLRQFNDTDVDTWTQEFRVSSNNTEGLRWVAGMYFDFEQRDQGPYGMQFPGFDPVTFDFLGNFEMNAESRTDSNTQALFGQVMIPFWDRFELTLGGRYQRIAKKIDLDMYYLPVGFAGPPMFSFKEDKTWYAFLPKAALSYRISDDWTAYASWSKGYMPGGFNYFAMAGGADENSFAPQRSSNYELGIKGSFDRLRLSAALFRMDIKDIHVYKAVGTMYLTDNAKKAHSQGVEFEAGYWLTDTIEVSAAVGFIDAKYDDYDIGVARFDGRRIEQTPSHTARLGIAYLHPRGFYARADVKNQGAMYFYDDGNKDFARESSYTVADLRLGCRFAAWDLYAYVKNLTDEKYVNAFKSNSMMAVAGFGEPRTFGGGIRYRF